MSTLLRKLESATPLPEADRQAVLRLPIAIRELPAGQDIVTEGECPTQACLVVSGWTCCYKLVARGGRQIIAIHLAGDVPDLQGVHLRVLDFSLATMSKATLAFIPHEAIREVATRFPAIGAAFWRETLVYGAVFREWMTGMGRRQADSRLAHLFCELYTKQEAIGLASDHRCPLPMTQGDLADATGITNVHVNRVMRALRGRKLVALRSGILTIHDWPALAELAEFDTRYLHFDT